MGLTGGSITVPIEKLSHIEEKQRAALRPLLFLVPLLADVWQRQ
jgi:hypothetical protein